MGNGFHNAGPATKQFLAWWVAICEMKGIDASKVSQSSQLQRNPEEVTVIRHIGQRLIVVVRAGLFIVESIDCFIDKLQRNSLFYEKNSFILLHFCSLLELP